MKTKKLLALIMALAMLLSSLPMAFADAVTEPEEPISEWGEVDLSDAAGEPVVEEGLQIEGDPIEEPEEAELVKLDINYEVTVIFKYGNPSQQDQQLILTNGVLTAAQEATIAPAEWKGHEFLGWTSDDFSANKDGDNFVALEEGADEPKGLKINTLNTHTFSNAQTIEVTAKWKPAKVVVRLMKGTADAGEYMPGVYLFDGVTGEGHGAKVEAGTKAAKLFEGNPVQDGHVDKYDYAHPICKVNGTVIDPETYVIDEATDITIEIPEKSYTVKFLKNADDTEAYATQTVAFGGKATKPETDPTKDHSVFKNWTYNGNLASFETAVNALEPAPEYDPTSGTYVAVMVAAWETEKVPVTFQFANGKDADKVVEVEYNTPVASQSASKEGATHVGWTLNGEDYNFATPVTAAITLVAKYSTNTVTLTYARTDYTVAGDATATKEVWPGDTDTVTPVNPVVETKDWGSDFTALSGVTREGWDFKYWTESLDTLDNTTHKPIPFTFTAVKANATLVAYWEKKAMPVTLDVGTLTGLKFLDINSTTEGATKDFSATLTAEFGSQLVQVDDDNAATALTKVELLPLKDVAGHDFIGWYYMANDAYGNPTVKTYVVEKNGDSWKYTAYQVLKEGVTLTAEFDDYYTVKLVKDATATTDAAKYYDGNANGYRVYLKNKGADNKLTFDDNADNATVTAASVYTEMDVKPDATHKYFAGWKNGTALFDLYTGEITGDLTLTADMQDVVALTFKLNEGKVNGDNADQVVVYYPKNTTLADCANLRINLDKDGNPKPQADIVIPAPVREAWTFKGWKVGSSIIDMATATFTEATTLEAQWEGKLCTVTLELDGGTSTDGTKIENVPYDATIALAIPTKADCSFDKWVTHVPANNEQGYTEEEFFTKDKPTPTKVKDDITVYAMWTTYVAKNATATAAPEGYYVKTADMCAANVADIILLKDVTIDADTTLKATNSFDLNGKTVTIGANATLTGTATIKNGNVKGGKLSGFRIASGTFEGVTLAVADVPDNGISGGFFKFAGDADAQKTAADALNNSGKIVEGKKLKLKDGYYTPTAYKTLYIINSNANVIVEKAGETYTITGFDPEVKAEVFEGDKTVEPNNYKKVGDDTAKLSGWFVVDPTKDKETGKAKYRGEAFTFGAPITADTYVMAEWVGKATLTYRVTLYDGTDVEWPVDTYDNEPIVEPTEPTEEEYAAMTKSKEENLREAWSIVKSDAFLDWQYQGDGGMTAGKNVAFGKDLATTCTIKANQKPIVTFWGLGYDLVDELVLNEGDTIGNRVPDAPEYEGYEFNYWVDAGGDILKPNEKIYRNTQYYATYSTENWAISWVDYNRAWGYSDVPATEVTIGGDDGLELFPVGPAGQGRYYIGFEIEAPNSVGLIKAESPNEVEWSYKMDDEDWKTFNKAGVNNDGLNANQHVVMKVYKEVTWDMLKELADAKAKKTWTVTLAPTETKDDEKTHKVFTVTLDPKNVELYGADVETVIKDDLQPVKAIENYNYKYTLTFDMDGGKAVKPYTVEYGTKFVPGNTTVVFEDNTIAYADLNTPELIKKYFTCKGFGYYKDEGEKELSPINSANGLTVRKDETIYAIYTSIPVYVGFFDETGNKLKDFATITLADNTEYGMGNILSDLVIPKDLANQYGVNAWYPAKLEGKVQLKQGPVLDTAPYDVKGTAVVGDTYYKANNAGFIFLYAQGPQNEGPNDGNLGEPQAAPVDGYYLALVRGAEEKGVVVHFMDGFGDVWYGNGAHRYAAYKDIENGTVYCEADADGNVKYGDVEVPDYERDGIIFNGWKLVPADVMYVGISEAAKTAVDATTNTDADWKTAMKASNGFVDLEDGDLKVFDFEANATKTFNHELYFIPELIYTNAGTATLYTSNVYFDGMIQVMIKYGFKDTDMQSWDQQYVEFSKGDEVLATLTLNDYSTKYSDTNHVNMEDNRYVYMCPVPIRDYTETIRVKVLDSEGNEWETKTGKGLEIKGGFEYSLEKYATRTEESTSATEKMKKLASALKDYGIASRLFCGETDVKITDLSAAVTDLTVDGMKGVNETESTPKDQRPEGVKVSQNVIFESDNTLVVTFTEGSGTYTYTVDGDPVEVKAEGGKVVLKVENIRPDELNLYHTFTMSDGSKTVTLKTSVLGYAKKAAKSGSENMQNLAKALYNYAMAAEVFNSSN